MSLARREFLMMRFVLAMVLLVGGCSTTPTADVCDFFVPARGVCSRSASPNAAGLGPGCAAALAEDQNYRPGIFARLRRRANYQPTIGVPPAQQVPAARQD